MISTLIHFVWLGPPMPDWAAKNIELFQKLNPGFICRVHGEESLLPFLAPAYHNISGEHLLSRRSDVLRISILVQYGGWYFDCDFLPIRSLSEIYRDQGDFPRECYVARGDWVTQRHRVGRTEDKDRAWIANGVIGTTANSPFLSCVLRGILLNDVRGVRSWDGYATKLFTEITECFPGIVHVGRFDDWFRFSDRRDSIAAYRSIRDAGYTREAIVRKLGDALPYAFHMGMQDETELK